MVVWYNWIGIIKIKLGDMFNSTFSFVYCYLLSTHYPTQLTHTISPHYFNSLIYIIRDVYVITPVTIYYYHDTVLSHCGIS